MAAPTRLYSRAPTLKEIEAAQEQVRAEDEKYVFDEAWRSAESVSVGDLQPTFKITSGELIWGHLRCLVAGMKATERDVLFSVPRKHTGPGTVYQVPWNHRVAAKPGDWKFSRVKRNDPSLDGTYETGWLAHHVQVDPQPLIEMSKDVLFGITHPRVSYVNRYDLAWFGFNLGHAERTISDIEPEVWRDAWSRKRDLQLQGYYNTDHEMDKAMWDRLKLYHSGAAFFCDALGAPGLVKLLAQPSQLDQRVREKHSSSVYLAGDNAPFGCHLHLPKYYEYEICRLIYGEEKSEQFPEDNEVIAVWYDYRCWVEDESVETVAVPF